MLKSTKHRLKIDPWPFLAAMCSLCLTPGGKASGLCSSEDQSRMGTEDRDHFFHTQTYHLISLGCIPYRLKDSWQRGDAFPERPGHILCRAQSPMQYTGTLLLWRMAPCPLESLFNQGSILNATMHHLSKALCISFKGVLK